MKSVEEKLWNYIDGSCSAEERHALAKLITGDEVYRSKYQELVKLNEEFNAIGFDEPSMAFTYKVMETIRATHARQPLKAAINKRIILGIAAFFAVTIVTLIIMMLENVNWHAGGTGIRIPKQLTVFPLENIFTGPVIKGFLFFDIVLGLVLLDTYLRRKIVTKKQQVL